MTDFRSDTRSPVSAIDAWENEGGWLAAGRTGEQFGRRIEADQSWTVYHVFSGVPAGPGSQPLVGMSKSDATTRMMSLNARAGATQTVGTSVLQACA